MIPSPAGRGTKGEGVKMQILSLLCIMATILAMTTGVWAHARLLRSDPGASAVLTVPPKVVRVWFDDELDPDRSTISVWDAREHRVDDRRGGVDLSDLDRKSMVARLRAADAGTYTVRWRDVSADDGFISQGRFVFTVRP